MQGNSAVPILLIRLWKYKMREKPTTEYQIATKGKRIVAFIIDNMVINLLLLAIYWDQIALMVDNQALPEFLNSIFIPSILLGIIYQTLFVYQYGMTLGKMLLKIRVVEIEMGNHPSFQTAILRAGFRAISDNSFLLGYLLAYMSPLLQTFHDKVAKTVVVDA